jgi:hypothetical protein
VHDALSVWCPITLCEVIWDATAIGAAPAVARYGNRQLALPWLGTAAVLSVLQSCPQLLPSLLQHSTTLCEVICNAAASGAALVIARYGRRLLTTPYIRPTAAK